MVYKSSRVSNAAVNLATGVTGILPAANGGAGTVNGILRANGSGAVSAAVAGTDYAVITVATQQSALTTSVDFTGIPATAKHIVIMFEGVTTNGTSVPLIQLGDSGGAENTGYIAVATGAGTSTAFTAGFGTINTANWGTDNTLYGAVEIFLKNAATFTWAATGILSLGNAAVTSILAGTKSTSAVLDRVRITTANGTDAFDGGTINISYE